MTGGPRRADAVRPTTIEAYPTGAPGSVMITQGATKILCTASVAKEVPAWMVDRAGGEPRQGWVTAEYAMMPGSSPRRTRRGPSSRGTEIQRLIGRALRASVNLEAMPGVTVTCDCDVVVADGGTRTASVTGGFVALVQGLRWARARGLIERDPVRGPVAAVSVGIVGGRPRLDLDYDLDVAADVDMNVAMNHRGEFVEVQATGERGTLRRADLDTLLDLATRGIRRMMTLQRGALREA